MRGKNRQREKHTKRAETCLDTLTLLTVLLENFRHSASHSATSTQSQNGPAAYAGPPFSIISSSCLFTLAALTVSRLFFALSLWYLMLFLSHFRCLDAPSLFVWTPVVKPKKLAVSWAAAEPKLNSLMAVKTVNRTRHYDTNLSLAHRAQIRLCKHSLEFWVLPATRLLSSWISVSLS